MFTVKEQIVCPGLTKAMLSEKLLTSERVVLLLRRNHGFSSIQGQPCQAYVTYIVKWFW